MLSAADFRMRHLVRVVLFAAVMLGVAACGGGGGGGSGGSPASVTISGKITFDRVPFKATLGTGLNFNGIVESPARHVVVEAVQPANVLGGENIVATTTTDAAGDYALQVPPNTTVTIRAKAQMLKTGAAPTWNFRVLNNTNNDALYVMEGTAASSGSGNSIRNLRATSGWGATGYTGTRAAAPFAILDTMYQVKSLVLSARADTAFPSLDLFWSVNNRSSFSFCPDDGNVVSSLYTTFSASSPNDECSTPTAGRDGIYVLGDYTQGDTDEFDQHVIAHEAGHYFEDRFSRSDSIGGEHSFSDKLDLRVALGEGWGDAFAAMVLNDPVYRDSFGSNSDNPVNFETVIPPARGWYSELSVAKILWDIFDAANEAGEDNVSVGFGPIHSVMTTSQPSTNALTAIFPMIRALKASVPAQVSNLDALVAGQDIATIGDDFGMGESTNSGGDVTVLPIYQILSLPIQVNVCSSGPTNGYNKLGNRKFLVFQLNAAQSAPVTIVASGAANSLVVGSTSALDPDVYVWRRGAVVAAGIVNNNDQTGLRGDFTHRETVSIPAPAAGTYVVEVYDSAFIEQQASNVNPHCMSVSIAG